MGIVAIEEAMKKASAASLDLVQLANDSEHPVCKLMDYGKHLFDKKKQKSASKKKQKRTQIKEIKFRPGTEENDYQIKLKSITRFIQDGDKAKITMRFRGREMAHIELGGQLLARVKADIEAEAKIEAEPKMEGRQMIMVLAPK